MNLLNIWSLGHFLVWALVGRFFSTDWGLFFVLSIAWEALELVLPFELARETWSNKLSDIVVNTIGFYVGTLSRGETNKKSE